MSIVQERRNVSEFDEFQMEGYGEVILEQGAYEVLIIEAEEALLPKIKSEIKNGRLTVGFEHWYDHLLELGTRKIIYRVTMRSVRGVFVSGSGNVTGQTIQTDRLRLKISGSGEMTIPDLRADGLEVSFSGAGKATLGGQVQRQEVHFSGSGNLQAEQLLCQQVKIGISGSGSARLNVSESLEVHISGSGDIRYLGQPRIEKSISGSGTVKPI